MTSGTWSVNEPSVVIDSIDELDQFVDFAESNAEVPTAISIEVHGYRVDFLVGHEQSFIHMTPDDLAQPYHVTIGEQSEGGVDFWLHSSHHTWFEKRHLIAKPLAREAFRVFFETGCLSPSVKWEDYFA